MKGILAIDQSTSGTKGLVFDLTGQLLARADLPHRQITNELGWVEHDPEEIYKNTLAVARTALEKSGLKGEDIGAVGLSNQRETAVCWNAATGKPVYNAIVWQCARAVDVTGELEAMGLADRVVEKTGLSLSPFYSAAKFGWMVRHVPQAQEALAAGNLRCGTVDSWLVYCLTGGVEHRTDYSNASRTQLLNLDTLAWDEELVEAFGLTMECMPQVCFSDSCFGYTTFDGLLPQPVPIHGVLGDSHGALFGHGGTTPGSAKVTYGTGSSIMLNVGAKRPRGVTGISTSLAWGIDGSVHYVLEGNINDTGAVIRWLVEDVELLSSSREAGQVACQVESTNGVYLVPAFSGLGAPYFKSGVRAALVGMNRSTKRAHIVRAAEECIAHQIADVVEAINAGSEIPLNRLHGDGGPTKDSFLMQFQSDMLGLPLDISCTEELSGGGAAYCAAIGSGLAAREEIFSHTRHTRVEPHMAQEQREALRHGWKQAVADVANMKRSEDSE